MKTLQTGRKRPSNLKQRQRRQQQQQPCVVDTVVERASVVVAVDAAREVACWRVWKIALVDLIEPIVEPAEK